MRLAYPVKLGKQGALAACLLQAEAWHEQASTALTSSKWFEEWGAVLGDELMAVEFANFLVHNPRLNW